VGRGVAKRSFLKRRRRFRCPKPTKTYNRQWFIHCFIVSRLAGATTVCVTLHSIQGCNEVPKTVVSQYFRQQNFSFINCLVIAILFIPLVFYTGQVFVLNPLHSHQYFNIFWVNLQLLTSFYKYSGAVVSPFFNSGLSESVWVWYNMLRW